MLGCRTIQADMFYTIPLVSPILFESINLLSRADSVRHLRDELML